MLSFFSPFLLLFFFGNDKKWLLYNNTVQAKRSAVIGDALYQRLGEYLVYFTSNRLAITPAGVCTNTT